jgi:hypothetical protein
VLVIVVMLVVGIILFAGVMFLTVLIVVSFPVSFMLVMLMIAVMFVGVMRLWSAALANGFTGQNFGSDRRGTLCRGVTVRIAMPMAVIVILEIFENVADVQKCVAVEADIDEGGLHTGEDASDAAFVDATDQRELFFALDINFD